MTLMSVSVFLSLWNDAKANNDNDNHHKNDNEFQQNIY